MESGSPVIPFSVAHAARAPWREAMGLKAFQSYPDTPELRRCCFTFINRVMLAGLFETLNATEDLSALIQRGCLEIKSELVIPPCCGDHPDDGASSYHITIGHANEVLVRAHGSSKNDAMAIPLVHLAP